MSTKTRLNFNNLIVPILVMLDRKKWSQPGAMRAMIRRRRPKTRGDSRVRVPVLLLWGMQDQALSHRMARLSIDYCDNGQLVLFENATHWVQHDEAESVNQYLLGFFTSLTSG